MKRLLLSTALITAIIAGGGFAMKANADTAGSTPTATAPDAGPGPGDAGPHGPWGGPGGPDGKHGPDGGPHGGHRMSWMHRHHNMFGLFARVKDKKLTTDDVKVIGSAILLEHGNHEWTVSNVKADGKAIDFSFVTAHGDVVASFAVDTASGHFKRVK